MTKREYRYHLIKKLFQPFSFPLCGTLGVSPVSHSITLADIKKAIAEIKASKPEVPNHIPELVSWDSQEEVKARQDFKYAAWMSGFGYFGYTPLQPTP